MEDEEDKIIASNPSHHHDDDFSTTILCFDENVDDFDDQATNDVEKEKKDDQSDDTSFLLPPTREDVLNSLEENDIPRVRYENPFFGNSSDKPDKLVGFQEDTMESLQPWPGSSHIEEAREKALLKVFGENDVKMEVVANRKPVNLKTVKMPPSRQEVEDWLRVRAAMKKIEQKKSRRVKKEKKAKLKILIRENPDDSEGSEISCSPVSSPDSSPTSTPTNNQGSQSRLEDSLQLSNHEINSKENSQKSDKALSPISKPKSEVNEHRVLTQQRSSDSNSPIPSPCSSSGSSPIPPSPESEPTEQQPASPRYNKSNLRNTSRIINLNTTRKKVLEQSFLSKIEEKDVDESPIISQSKRFKKTGSEPVEDKTPIMKRNTSDGYKSDNISQENKGSVELSSRSILVRRTSDDMFAGSPDDVAADVGSTPTLRSATSSRLTAKNKLKRRISWQLPQQDNQTQHSDNNTDHHQQSSQNLSDVRDNICINEDTELNKSSNESMDHSSNDTTIAQSILDKLDDTELMKKYVTPKQVKDSSSYVETPLSGGSGAVPLLDLQNAAKAARNDHLSMLVVEIFCASRGQLSPDPTVDQIQGIFYSIVRQDKTLYGCIILSPDKEDLLHKTGITGWRVRYVETEDLMFKNIVRLVRDSDPDILAGYEIQLHSWGYIFQRAFHLGINLCPLVSRIPSSVHESKMTEDSDNPGAQYNADHTSEISLVGRIIFNSWRILRSELALYSYTLQNVANSVLGKRIPYFTNPVLTKAWSKHKTRYKAVKYMMLCLEIHNDIMSRLDLLSRTSELARLFGIQFYEVISRGSQFRVESSMLRLAKPRNYVPVSPTRQQLASQAAPEYLALLLEPESRMYTDPVIVLDFQSLYPSIIIGYNYCYSTCLGRIEKMGEPGIYTFGCTQLQISPERLEALRDHITISPGGIVFLKPNIRKGVLPQMLQDILNTRIMVKQSMKKHGKDPDLQKILHSRQLGLKLIANVTYGYTSANFSGRMPCIEVGDSVVSKAREALEMTIRKIESTPRWGGKVVYGDTDSVFVLLKGKSKDEAFDIGEEMAQVVTDMNPKPMKLKFEKVYLPCILQTKKRYVGYMYETRNQDKPVFDAKGIETVRRDGIPATTKILEKSIRILFETKDISQVKSYVQSQFMKIISGSLSIQDLTFAKEFRGLQGYRPTACVPALEITKNRIKKDRRMIPRTGERVPYVVVYGEPGLPLIQLVREPQEVLDNSELRPNGQYYITKVIVPPLNRCMLLVGVDTLSWFSELPRIVKPCAELSNARRGVISKYFITQSCVSCAKFTMGQLCDTCKSKKNKTAVNLSYKIYQMENDIQCSILTCTRCTGDIGTVCTSLDCPHLYRRSNAIKMEDQIRSLTSILADL